MNLVMLKCCFFQCSLALDIFTLCADLGKKPELIPGGKQTCRFPSSASKPEITAEPEPLVAIHLRGILIFFNKFAFHSQSKTGSEEAYQNKIITENLTKPSTPPSSPQNPQCVQWCPDQARCDSDCL